MKKNFVRGKLTFPTDSQIVIFDNGGRTPDRYAVLIKHDKFDAWDHYQIDKAGGDAYLGCYAKCPDITSIFMSPARRVNLRSLPWQVQRRILEHRGMIKPSKKRTISLQHTLSETI